MKIWFTLTRSYLETGKIQLSFETNRTAQQGSKNVETLKGERRAYTKTLFSSVYGRVSSLSRMCERKELMGKYARSGCLILPQVVRGGGNRLSVSCLQAALLVVWERGGCVGSSSSFCYPPVLPL